MNRRGILAGLLGSGVLQALAGTALAADRVRRIGILTGTPLTSPTVVAVRDAFADALRERGWEEGRNVAIEARSAEGRPERFAELAAELVRLEVDVILAPSSQAVSAAMARTRTIPIVMIDVSHPVEAGFVSSLSRPGGNVTGLTNQLSDLADKHLDLLREVVPGLEKVAVFFSPSNTGSRLGLKGQEGAARRLGATILPIPVESAAEIEQAFAVLARERPQALHIHPTPASSTYRGRILALAMEHRLPTAAAFRSFGLDGALVAYGPNQIESWRRAAVYVDRVLRGASPADLPVEQPTKFDLIVNLRTARTLGLTVPPALLARADEVIE